VGLYVCLSACRSASISLEPLISDFIEFTVHVISVAVVPMGGGVAIRYVLPVLWMTSCFPIMGAMMAYMCERSTADTAASPQRDGVQLLTTVYRLSILLRGIGCVLF